MSARYTRITVTPDIGEALQVGAKAPFVVNLSQSISGVTIEELTKVSSEVKKDALSASNSAKAAKVSETNAKGSADSAKSQADLAKEQVVLATEQVDEAKNQVGLAKEQVVSATEQASAAKNQADLAKEQVGLATEQVSKAKDQVGLAKEQVVLATEQANVAANQALEATTQASLAKASSDEAATQAALATTKADEAKASAESSSTSAIESKNSATEADNSANFAEQNSQDAKASADAAKVSETNAKGSADSAETSLNEIKSHTYDKGTVDSKLAEKVNKDGDTMTGSLVIEAKQFGQKIEINADAEQDRTSIGNKFKDGSLAVLSFYKDKLRYAGKDVLRVGDFGLGRSNTTGDKHTQNANDINFTGVATPPGSNGTNYWNNYYPLLSMVRGGGNIGNNVQLQITPEGVAYRRTSTNEWVDWIKLLSVGDYGVGLNAKTGTTKAESTNANNLDTNGFWASGGSNSSNFYNPFGPLISFARGGGVDGTGQVVQIQASSKNLAYRMRNVNNWTYWSELMNVRSDGVKSSKNDFQNNGFYTSTNIDSESPATVFMGIISAHATQPDGYQTGIFGRGKKLFYTYKENNQWVATYEILHAGNARPDSNGFYKKASPIIDINPDGTFTTNDESEGAIVTRVAQGEYLIEGVLGFNSDAGWGGADGGIEIPLDVNKQPLIWVDYKVMEDGSILIKTYHRTHPSAPKFARNDIAGYSDGDPIDIPNGRFISVRVQMPEQSVYNVRMREMEEDIILYEKYRKPIDEAWENKPEYINDAMDKFLNI